MRRIALGVVTKFKIFQKNFLVYVHDVQFMCDTLFYV